MLQHFVASLLFKSESNAATSSDRSVRGSPPTYTGKTSNVTLFHCVNCGHSHALSVVFEFHLNSFSLSCVISLVTNGAALMVRPS